MTSDLDMETNTSESEAYDKKRKKIKIVVQDKDGFQVPPKRLTRKALLSQPAAATEVDNMFHSLSDGESESSTTSIVRKRKKPGSEVNNPSSLLKPVNDGKSSKPIRIPNITFAEIQATLNTLTLSKKPMIKKAAGKTFHIIPSSVEDKKKILQKLGENSIANFTHSEPNDRHSVFIIKGHHQVTAEELLETLKIEKVPASKVSQIGRASDDPIYLVSFEKGAIDFHTLSSQHQIIGGLKIKWEKFKPRTKRYVQCKRCQRWGHGAANCNMPRRCVKCQETHEIGECSRKSASDEGEPSCINCGETGHPANSTTCRAFKKHVENISKMKKNTPRPRTFNSTPAPWATQSTNINFNNKNFPSLSTNVNSSTNQIPENFHGSSREYRPFLTQPRTKESQAKQQESFGLFSMQGEIMAIPGMEETMALYRKLKEKLNANHNPMAQLKVLFEFGLVV